MKDRDKTKEELLRELAELRGQAAKSDALTKECVSSYEALQKHENLYRILVEEAQDMIFVIDRKDTVRYVNAFAARSLGYPQEEIMGKPRRDFFPPGVADLQGAILQRVFETGSPEHAEDRIPVQGGGELWISTRLIPIRDNSGRIHAVMGISRDITGRRKTEEALRASEEKYKALVELTSDMIYISDVKGCQLFMNAPGIARLEALPEEVIGQPWSKWIHPEDRERSTSTFQEMLGKGIDVFDFQNRYVSKSGRVMHALHNVRVLRDQDGVIVGTQGIARDISGIRKAEEVRRESENKFRILAEKSPNMIFINQMGRIIYTNEQCTEVMGFTREEFSAPGFNFLFLISPEHVDLARENFLKHLQGREVPPHEYCLVTKGGKRVEAIITTKLIEYDNKPAILGIVTDITERKKMEKALMESERQMRLYATQLEESNNALKVLLRQRESDKRELEEKILANIRNLILPYLAKLKTNRQASDDLIYLNILESNLREIVSPFSVSLSSASLGLTPKEMLIADLVKDGKQDKEISEILNISPDTVKVHRKNVRKKLGIAGNRTNLRAHLMAMLNR